MKSMKYIIYRKGYKYQLAEDYVTTTRIMPQELIRTDYITLSPTGALLVKKGYAFDGPSGPTIDTPNSMRGSLGHDAKYQLIRLAKLPYQAKVLADEEFYEDLIEDGMREWRAKLWKWSVEKFGRSSACPSGEPIVHTAP